jgi:hypothetical protein
LEKIHVQKLVSVVKEKLANRHEEASWTKDLKKHLHDIMSLGVGTELLITPNTTLLLELYDIKKGDRGKAIFHHKAKNLDALKLFGIQLVICGYSCCFCYNFQQKKICFNTLIRTSSSR